MMDGMVMMMVDDAWINVLMCMHVLKLLFHFRGHPWILLWAARLHATKPHPHFYFFSNDGTRVLACPVIVEIYSFQSE